jgi:hypothetical protein
MSLGIVEKEPDVAPALIVVPARVIVICETAPPVTESRPDAEGII